MKTIANTKINIDGHKTIASTDTIISAKNWSESQQVRDNFAPSNSAFLSKGRGMV